MILLIFTILVMYVLYTWIKMKPPNFPPGPPYVPFFGSLPFMPKNNVHYIMPEWCEKYGGVVGLPLGFKRLTFAVCDPKLVREILKRDEFIGRPVSEFMTIRSFNKRIGIMFADGPVWQEQRRFAVRHLKEFGFGKTSMENIILEEIEDLLQEIKDQTVQVSGLFNLSSVNVLWGITAGTRYKRSDPHLRELMELLTTFFRSGNPTGGNVKMLFPFMRYIIPNWNVEIKAATDQLNAFFAKTIQEHEKTIDVNNPRDFIDVYITEMKAQKDSGSFFDVENLITVCSDLFSAGSESVGNTLGFAMMYMVLYPEIQEKVHAAIDSCIGHSRKPSLQDRLSLPYVEAVIMEVQRCNTIAPLTIPHRALQDTTFNGYFIPKNAVAFPSIWSILQDKNHWGDPENFRPARFIGEDGKLIKDETFIPFGVGKRLCPGEALARNTLFLFFTSLMQEYSVHLPPGSPKPSTESLPGFTTAPKPFEVTFQSRDVNHKVNEKF